jgi:hypothetical protein
MTHQRRHKRATKEHATETVTTEEDVLLAVEEVADTMKL